MTETGRAWLSLGWLMMVTISWLVTLSGFWKGRPLSTQRWPALAIIGLVAIIVRIVPALLLPSGATFDTTSYAIVGSLVQTRHDVYTTPLAEGRHPYLPLQLYAYAAAHWLATTANLPFAPLTKIPPIAADAVLALLLSRTMNCCRREQGWQAGLLYALHPVAVYVSAYHGQFDAEPVLATLLAGLAIESGHHLIAGLWLGLGILLKLWPAFVAPFLVSRLPWRGRLATTAGLVSIPLIGVALYRWIIPGSWAAVFKPALSYAGVPGWWGYTAVLRLTAVAAEHPWLAALRPWQPAKRLAQAALFGRYATLGILLLVSLLLWHRHVPVIDGQLVLTLTFLAVTAGFGVQYLIWPVPFAVAAGHRRALCVYTLACMLFLVGANALGLLQAQLATIPFLTSDDAVRALGLAAWLATVGWWLSCLRHQPRGTHAGQ